MIEIPHVKLTVAVSYNRPKGNQVSFFNDLETLCLEKPNCLLMGDLNFDQLDPDKHSKLTNLLESNGFALLNAIDKRAVTRQKSATIIDLVATNMLHRKYKISIVHHGSSDHAIVYTSMKISWKRPASYTSKEKLNLDDAVARVNELCDKDQIKSGNDLNVALQGIVNDCTTKFKIKSDHRIIKSHVNRDLILAVRELSRLYNLSGLHPDNKTLSDLYLAKKSYVERTNFELRKTYEYHRIAAAAGNNRKTWKLYKEVVFNHQQKHDKQISINGVPVSDSIMGCNKINEHFCCGWLRHRGHQQSISGTR